MHTRLYIISLTGSQLLPVMKMTHLHLSVTMVAVYLSLPGMVLEK